MPRVKNKYDHQLIREEIIDLSIKLANDVDNIDLLLCRSILHLSIQNIDEAVSDINQVLFISPNNTDALYLKAEIELNYGYPSDSPSVFDKVLMMENIDIDKIDLNLLQFYKLLLSKRKQNIINKIHSTFKIAETLKNYKITAKVIWN